MGAISSADFIQLPDHPGQAGVNLARKHLVELRVAAKVEITATAVGAKEVVTARAVVGPRALEAETVAVFVR